mgnify:CR=1 FL=1
MRPFGVCMEKKEKKYIYFALSANPQNEALKKRLALLAVNEDRYMSDIIFEALTAYLDRKEESNETTNQKDEKRA